MLLIPCPHCGPRPETEFVYGGDGGLKRPDPATATDEEWAAYLFLRDNPKGQHQEFWLHAAGCHQWLRVERDTVTHAISNVAAARESGA